MIGLCHSSASPRVFQHFLLAILLAWVPLSIADQSGGDPSSLTFWQDGDAGDRMNLRGRVLDTQGKPVAGANIRVRQADGNANYTARYQGELVTADDGSFSLRSAVPGQYTSAKHVHISVSHPQYQALHTELLFKGDPNLDLSTSGGIEVFLEEVQSDSGMAFVGGVEIVLEP